MKRAALATLDWFIPNAALIERSEIGLARNFIVTHLLGPFLIQSIVILVYWTDPNPGFACWAMMACVAAFWLLPFGLKVTQDLRLMALISVELLCVTALIGTSFYGGVNSPFLTWLLVSLMLGFFYLSNHAKRVLGLFAFNIVVAVGAHLFYSFPQRLSTEDLAPISWLSVFSATAYMSLMAIYYANIISMGSSLERETERHRQMAQRLRKAKAQADAASHGKSVFLAKMRREFEQPLINVVASSAALVERLDQQRTARSWKPEVERIQAAGQLLLGLVQDMVDPKRITSGDGGSPASEFDVAEFIERLAAAALPLGAPYGQSLVLEPTKGLGRARVDSTKLRQAMEILMTSAASTAAPGTMLLTAHRERNGFGDWIEFEIRTGSSRIAPARSPEARPDLRLKTREGGPIDGDAALELSQMHFAVLGGNLNVTRLPSGGDRFVVRIPAFQDEA